MTAPRTDPHDGWTPQPQEQVQPGDPWRDPDDGDPEYQDAAYSAGVAPRTDPPTPDPLTTLHITATAREAINGVAATTVESGYILNAGPNDVLREALDGIQTRLEAQVFASPIAERIRLGLLADIRAALSEATTSPEATLDVERLAEIVSDSLAATTEGTDYAEAPEPSDEPGSPYVMRLTNELAARLRGPA